MEEESNLTLISSFHVIDEVVFYFNFNYFIIGIGFGSLTWIFSKLGLI
jgi:hypothetical protein